MEHAAENDSMAIKPEIRRIVEGYESSEMTRRAYSTKHNIPITTLDYWRRTQKNKPTLVEVELEPSPAASGFALVLANGRRIESSWSFAEADLLRLIRG
jgi:hypothetical protein